MVSGPMINLELPKYETGAVMSPAVLYFYAT
jgi:hypothetical protein